MTTLADLKKRRDSDFSKLTKALEDTGKHEGGSDDTTFWKPDRDKAGNGLATIRFLPAYQGDDAVEGDGLPWVKMYSHSFQGPTGRWYIENCRSTIGGEDPVNDANRVLWKGSEEDKKLATTQKRKLTYISRIKVISDPKHPENNGKQFFFKYGKKIFDKITDATKPTFEDEKPVNVFDLWEGANFKLRIKTVDKFPNYDSSVFETPTAIADTDEEILEIVNEQKSIGQHISIGKFKSYDELDKKFKSVMNPTQGSTRKAEDVAAEMRAESIKTAIETAEKESSPFEEPTKVVAKSTTKVVDDDDVASFFDNIDMD